MLLGYMALLFATGIPMRFLSDITIWGSTFDGGPTFGGSARIVKTCALHCAPESDAVSCLGILAVLGGLHGHSSTRCMQFNVNLFSCYSCDHALYHSFNSNFES